MAKLDNTERQQLQAPSRPGCAAPPPPPPPALAPREYVAFATFASRFLPATKPAFGGRQWKL